MERLLRHCGKKCSRALEYWHRRINSHICCLLSNLRGGQVCGTYACQSNGWLMTNRRGFCLVGKLCKLYLNAANVPVHSAKRNAACSTNILANLWSMGIIASLISGKVIRCSHCQLMFYALLFVRRCFLIGLVKRGVWGCWMLRERSWRVIVGCDAVAVCALFCYQNSSFYEKVESQEPFPDCPTHWAQCSL